MHPPEGLQPYLDAFTDEINELRRRNTFLEDQYEFLLRRLEVHEDHTAEPDYAAVTHLNLGAQMRYVVASLLARYPKHVTLVWLRDNLPNHDANSGQDDEPYNHIRVIIARVRRFFFDRGIDTSVVSLRDLGYSLSPEAETYIRGKNCPVDEE